jgi:hypothetical protein
MMIIIMMTANSIGPEEGPVALPKFCECCYIYVYNNEVGVKSVRVMSTGVGVLLEACLADETGHHLADELHAAISTEEV